MLETVQRTYKLSDQDLIFADKSENQYVLRVKDLPDQEKPHEKLVELGPGNLSLAELLSVVWGVGNRNEDVLTMAKRTLKEYGEKTIGGEFNARRLSEATNIPLTKAAQLVASFELGRG